MARRALPVVTLLAATFCGGCAYTIDEEDLFYPRRVPLEFWLARKPAGGVMIRPVQFPSDGPVLRGWLFTPPDVRRHMVHFYGNGELAAATHVVRRAIHLARALQCEILVMDYRGYGFTAGTPSFDTLQRDALRGYDFMAQRASGRGVLVYGLSIGTVASVHVAAQRRPAGLILQAPPTAAAEIIPGLRELIPIPVRWFLRVVPSQKLLDLRPQPVETLARVTCPLLVIHGSEDRIVPIRFGRRMLEAAGSKSKRFVEVPQAGHNNLSLSDAEVIGALKQFVNSASP